MKWHCRMQKLKSLAVGNPYIKEKMDLDIQVSKLQLLKQSFLSQKYEMEDKAVRYFPNEIKQCEQRIEDYESDIALAKANTPPDWEHFRRCRFMMWYIQKRKKQDRQS